MYRNSMSTSKTCTVKEAHMGYERNQTDTIEKLEIIIGAAQRKYVTVKEGAGLYGMGIHGFDKLAKDAGAKRKIGTRVLINTHKLDDYIEMMFSD